MLVCLRDRSAQTIVRAATFRQKLQIKLSTSPSQGILTPGQPVPALTLSRQAPGRVASRVTILKSLVSLRIFRSQSGHLNHQDPGNPMALAGIELRIFSSRGGHLNHWANEAVILGICYANAGSAYTDHRSFRAAARYVIPYRDPPPPDLQTQIQTEQPRTL